MNKIMRLITSFSFAVSAALFFYGCVADGDYTIILHENEIKKSSNSEEISSSSDGAVSSSSDNTVSSSSDNATVSSSSNGSSSSSSIDISSSSLDISSSSSVTGGSSSSVGNGSCSLEQGSVTDVSGKTYKTVKLGNQWWMAENLNYDVPNNSTDVCYGNDPTNCAEYGRLYDWATAMKLNASCNTSNCATQISANHQGICPDGWYIPSEDDWNEAKNFLYPYSDVLAGTYDFCFSAQLGGVRYYDNDANGGFSGVGGLGAWWSASEYTNGTYRYAYYLYIISNKVEAVWANDNKAFLFSVRCVKGSSRVSSSSTQPSSSSSHVHNWGEWEVTTPATCSEAGIRTRSCTNDSSEETEAIPQLSWNDWEVTAPATCEEEGVKTKTCPGDASPAQTQAIPKLVWGEWEITTQATQTTLATGKRTCPNGDVDTTDSLTVCGSNINNVYDPEKEFCQGSTVKELCGNKTYTSTQFCQDGTVKELCGSATYSSDQFCDSRDNKVYKFVTINGKTWMAQNLNYRTENGASRCHQGNSAAKGTYGTSDADNNNCATYGRLYNWATAMNNATSSSANPSGRQGVCPAGWHLPSEAEWLALSQASGGTGANGIAGTAGQALKAKSPLWYTNTGTDLHGFSALPGGSYDCDDCPFNQANYNNLNYAAIWWTSTQQNATEAWQRNVFGASNILNRSYYLKTYLYSVRCVKD